MQKLKIETSFGENVKRTRQLLTSQFLLAYSLFSNTGKIGDESTQKGYTHIRLVFCRILIEEKTEKHQKIETLLRETAYFASGHRFCILLKCGDSEANILVHFFRHSRQGYYVGKIHPAPKTLVHDLREFENKS